MRLNEVILPPPTHLSPNFMTPRLFRTLSSGHINSFVPREGPSYSPMCGHGCKSGCTGEWQCAWLVPFFKNFFANPKSANTTWLP